MSNAETRKSGRIARQYSPISNCESLRAWIWSRWDFRSGWKGPYVEIRTVGWRFLGFEFEHEELR